MTRPRPKPRNELCKVCGAWFQRRCPCQQPPRKLSRALLPLFAWTVIFGLLAVVTR